jgi:hypothetical protein
MRAAPDSKGGNTDSNPIDLDVATLNCPLGSTPLNGVEYDITTCSDVTAEVETESWEEEVHFPTPDGTWIEEGMPSFSKITFSPSYTVTGPSNASIVQGDVDGPNPLIGLYSTLDTPFGSVVPSGLRVAPPSLEGSSFDDTYRSKSIGPSDKSWPAPESPTKPTEVSGGSAGKVLLTSDQANAVCAGQVAQSDTGQTSTTQSGGGSGDTGYLLPGGHVILPCSATTGNDEPPTLVLYDLIHRQVDWALKLNNYVPSSDEDDSSYEPMWFVGTSSSRSNTSTTAGAV